ncbi:MAG: hypothetical protein R3A12_18360 [Ignavibacteria bacterium]
MVTAGIITGNKSKKIRMSKMSVEYVDKFWELIDEIPEHHTFCINGTSVTFNRF